MNSFNNLSGVGESVANAERISPAVLRLCERGIVPHAMLLCGADSAVNAEYIAKSVVCIGGDNGIGENKPCGNCSACKKAEDKNHPDIIYCKPVKPGNPYPVDFVRSVRSDAYIKPNESEKKVYIFTDVNNISVQSQNALLKILEEPPASVVFILCCVKKANLLDTIISRVSMVTCGAVKDDDFSDEADALAKDIAKACVNGSEYELLKLTAPLVKDKALLTQVLNRLTSVFRAFYLAKCGDYDDCGELCDFAKQYCATLTLNKAMLLSDAVRVTIDNMNKNANAQLNITRFCALLKSAVGQ